MSTNTKQPMLLLQDRDCLSAYELQEYVKGMLSVQEKQSIESHLLDCPLCSDAVDGTMQYHVQVPVADLRAARTSASSSGTPRFWLAAASLLLATALGSWLFYNFQENPETEKLALQSEKSQASSPTSEVNPVPSSDAQVMTNEHVSDETSASTPKVQLAQSDRTKENSATDRVAKDSHGSTNEDTQKHSSDLVLAEMPAAVAEEKTGVATAAKSQAAPAATRSVTRTETIDAERTMDPEDISIQSMFARQQYQAILDRFKKDNSQEALLFKGKSLYILKRYKEALQTLQQLTGTAWIREADWMSANCLMELGKTEKAKDLLEKLSKSEGPYQKEAAAILEQIKK